MPGDLPRNRSERPGRPEERPTRPEMRLEPPATDDPIIFPGQVPYIPQEQCPGDCKPRQEELPDLRHNIIGDGAPLQSVIVFNVLARDHNLRCGLLFYVPPLDIAH